MYYKHKISLSCGGSDISFPDWIKKKEAAMNPKTSNGKCFRYPVTITLNDKNIENHPVRM